MSSASFADEVRAIEWSFETETGVYGQAAGGALFVYDSERVPLTVIDEAEVQIEIGEPVLVRSAGVWTSCDWGAVVNTVRFRRTGSL